MWKNGAKAAACLTFDCDSDISWKNIMRRTGAVKEGEPYSQVVLSQGQYGPNVAIPRILSFLDKHELKGCFYVPGLLAEERPALIKEISSQGHEIGHHGYAHLNPSRLSAEDERKEMVKGLEALDAVTGKRPRGYRAPAFDISPRTLDLLCEFGFTYESNMMAWDTPYLHEVKGGRIVEIPFNWLTMDWTYFAFNFFPPLEYQSGISSQEDVLEIWSEEFEGLYEEGALFTIVMHPQAIGRPSRMRMLDRLVKRMKKKGKVWIATPLEIAEYWLENRPSK
ncbi:MAG: polysaccharide deacetylase [Euryarchaeota archaeon]|nr:polysaccharide deacetylase [Euryarchaeota archaeon]